MPASLLGTTVEWYDFFLWSTAAGLVFGKLFFPAVDGTVGTMPAFATFAVGFVARPVGGLGARRVYLVGMSAFTVSVLPAFWLFGTGGTWAFAAALVVTLGVVHASFYGAQGTLFATPVRYTGTSFVYQVSGVFASGITPLIMTALLALGSGDPWWACGYLVLTGLVSVWATSRLREEDQAPADRTRILRPAPAAQRIRPSRGRQRQPAAAGSPRPNAGSWRWDQGEPMTGARSRPVPGPCGTGAPGLCGPAVLVRP
ncbi:hypothetical protein [Streptomyces sp. NPDC049970]|uniref:hypothetical protein n=1 Tax=Streptomyces sp. NPDC049970 TaxID=3155033 RepID=UPI003421B20C